MPNYHRNYAPGGTYFLAVVTHGPRPFFASNAARKILHIAIDETQKCRPFALDAIVLLPDHLHAIWTLPAADHDYSTRWARIKSQFTRQFLKSVQKSDGAPFSRKSGRERAVWQQRFWEHTCRDADDFERCIDYLHFNPVKHGLAKRVGDYHWSSFHRYVLLGKYDRNWGSDPQPKWEPPAGWE